jgi:hypothetical protein
MSMNIEDIVRDFPVRLGDAVAHYWRTRTGQRDRQVETGKVDHGLRSAVTGGAQMDGFIDLFTDVIVAAGMPEGCVFRKKAVELPGFFRPAKEWDVLVVRDETLLVAMEAKSQAGASYMRRYEIFCRKLVLERHYSAAAFVSSTEGDGIKGGFATPSADLSAERFARALASHVAAHA